MSTRRRTLGIYASPAPKGPDGERLCRNCRKTLEKGQRHNCSRRCSDEWMCKTSPSHLRYKLKQRDKGVCATCSVDTIAQQAEYRKRASAGKSEHSWRWQNDYEVLQEYGIPPHRASGDWWDADHIVPVIEGGGECGTENYRTLCIPCHKRVTADLRRRMAERTKSERAKRNDIHAPLLTAAEIE